MIDSSIVYKNFKGKREYLPMARSEGALIWDRNGKEYIDFTSAWNVTNLGWNHSEVREAVIEQAKKNVHSLIWGSDPIQEEYAEALTDALPGPLDACVKENSGTEAVETAIKIARAYTKRSKIIGFENTYHGQLFASLALGNNPEKHKNIGPLVPEISPIFFPEINSGKEGFEKFSNTLEALLSKQDVAAVITEPNMITGGDFAVAYPGFLSKVRELTEKYSTLLIVDEVGTGFSRTGRLFAIEHEGVVPDMLCLAKGIANGAAPIATIVGKSEIFKPAFDHAVLTNTFGWNPVACAAALKTLQIHQRDKVWEMAEEKGKYLLEKLKELIGEKIISVRGVGMEISVDFKDVEVCQAAQKKAFANGLHITLGAGDYMQIMPPLTISYELIDKGLEILKNSLE